jgi:hypothetical protein
VAIAQFALLTIQL